MGFQKVDKEFCLTDNSVNVYGYRCLTEGFLQDRFNPPIGFLNHNRELGVAVRWEDFRLEGDKVYAKPVVNTTKFPNLAEEIENGFYQGASPGKIVALEMSDDKTQMIEGQTGVTVTQWFPREISIVDIPGNYSALAKLYDESDNVIKDLSDQTKSNLNIDNNMDKIVLNAAQIAALNLSDNYSQSDFSDAIDKIVAKASKVNELQQDLQNLQDKVCTEKVQTILDKAMAESRITKELSEKLAKDYSGNPEGLQALVDNLPTQVRVTGDDNPDNVAVPDKYKGKTFNDLYLSGELEEVKRDCPAYYETLIK